MMILQRLLVQKTLNWLYYALGYRNQIKSCKPSASKLKSTSLRGKGQRFIVYCSTGAQIFCNSQFTPNSMEYFEFIKILVCLIKSCKPSASKLKSTSLRGKGQRFIVYCSTGAQIFCNSQFTPNSMEYFEFIKILVCLIYVHTFSHCCILVTCF